MDVSFPTQLELMKSQHLVACHHPAAGYCIPTCCVGAPGLIPLDTSLEVACQPCWQQGLVWGQSGRIVVVSGLWQMVSGKGLGRNNDCECSKCLQT